MLPLCCIINQQYRIVTGCWSLVVDSRMTAFKIVGVYIFSYRLSVIVKVVVSKILIFIGYIYIGAAGLYSRVRAAKPDE